MWQEWPPFSDQKCNCTQNICPSVPILGTPATKSWPWVWIQAEIQAFHHMTKTIFITNLWSGSSGPSRRPQPWLTNTADT